MAEGYNHRRTFESIPNLPDAESLQGAYSAALVRGGDPAPAVGTYPSDMRFVAASQKSGVAASLSATEMAEALGGIKPENPLTNSYADIDAIKASDFSGFGAGTVYETVDGCKFVELDPGDIDFDVENTVGVRLRYITIPSGDCGLAGVTCETFTPSASDPRVLESFGGVLYGTFGLELFSKGGEASAWVKVADIPDTAVTIAPMVDGEVVLVTKDSIYKSSGWGGTPTWTLKQTNNGGSAVFLRYSSAGYDDGVNMIVGEYATGGPNIGWEDSTQAWATRDSGDTWQVVFDSAVMFGTNSDISHIHGTAYDPWSGLWFVIEGHSSNMGIYWNADPFGNPGGWARITKGDMAVNPVEGQPTVIVPTVDGIVLASDAPQQGIWTIARADDPADMSVNWSYEWPAGRVGTNGFGQSWTVDRKTGCVFMGYAHNATGANNPLAIFASDGVSGGIVWQDDISSAPSSTPNNVLNIAVTPWRTVIAQTSANSEVGSKVITGTIAGGGFIQTDSGRVSGGIVLSNDRRSNAIGTGSCADGSLSLAVGDGSEAKANLSTAIGINAKSLDPKALSIGPHAESSENSITIGASSTSGSNTVVIGNDVDATGIGFSVSISSTGGVLNAQGTGVGQAFVVGDVGGTAYGAFSDASGILSTAIGQSAKANAGHTFSVALGNQASTTSPNQVNMGAMHMELRYLPADPAAPTGDAYRLWARDAGGGAPDLFVIGSDGNRYRITLTLA